MRRLLDSLQGRDFRQNVFQQAAFIQQFHAAASRAFGQQLGQFFTDSFRGHLTDFVSMQANGGKGFCLDPKSKTRREAHCAQHAQFIFSEAPCRFADGPYYSGVQIRLSGDEIENSPRVVAHQQAVDGEVTTLNVLLGAGCEHHSLRVAAVSGADVRPKRSHLHMVAVARHDDYAKLRAHRDGLGK